MPDAPTLDDLLSYARDGTLVPRMVRRFDLQDHTALRSIAAACATLHNDNQIDVLAPIEAGELSALSGPAFFAAQQFLCEVLPNLDLQPERLMRCVDMLVTQGGQDFAATQPFVAFRAWCERAQARSAAVIASARTGDPLAKKFFGLALESTRDLDTVRNAITEFSDDRQLSAIAALGGLPHPDRTSRQKTITALATAVREQPSDPICARSLTTAATVIASEPPALRDELDLFRMALEKPGPQTLFAAARVLWTSTSSLSAEIVQIALQSLRAIDPAHKGTVRELDHALNALMQTDHVGRAKLLVSQLISESTLELQEFPMFLLALREGPALEIGRTTIAWLLSGESKLCQGLGDLLRQRGEIPVNVEASDLPENPDSQIFLCRKAIGYLFLEPVAVASVLVSVLRVCNDETAASIQGLLDDPVMRNFHAARKYVANLAVDDPAKLRAQNALEKSELYLHNLRQIPDIRELRPSERNQNIERVRTAEQMQKLFQEARKQSVFYDIVKHSTVLYGNRSINYVGHSSGPKRPVEIELKQHEFSFEMPIIEIVDPVGLNLMLFAFRVDRLPQ